MNKKIIIGIVAIVAIGFFGLMMIGGDDKNETEDAEIHYNYEIQEPVTSFINVNYPKTVSASEGFKFVPVKIVIKNNDYESYDGKGYSPAIGNLEVKGSDGNIYEYSTNTHNYSNTCDGLYDVKLGKGNEKRFTVLYQIPVDVSAVGMVWDGYASSYHNTSLNV